MNNRFSRREQREKAAHQYRLECLNARGETECSECGADVNEARGNRNAQELEREGVRKNKGPICNACQASWRYSHHQDSEMEMANSADEHRIDELQDKMLRDHWDELQAGSLNPVAATYVQELSKLTRLSVVQVIAQLRSGGLNEFSNASGCGICGEKGHVYDVDGDKKILCEKHAAEKGGVLLSNADDKSKCSRCGADVGALGVEHGYDVYCVDCAVKKGYIDKKDVP